MTVSIIIPCFNQERFVAEALDSALTQSAPDVEVIVVNDGSRDSSAAVIAGTKASHPELIVVEQPNRGLAAARNAGLDAARGDVIIFLDADDRLRPEAAAAAVAAFAAHPVAMMTFGRCTLIDEHGAPLLTNLPVVEHDFYAELLRRNYIWTPAMAAFRRDVFTRIGRFNPSVNASADYDLYLRLAHAEPIVAHHTTVADYRQHDSNMSRDPVAMLVATLAVLRTQRPHVRQHPSLAAAYREGMRSWRAFYGEHLVERFRGALHTRRYRHAARDAAHLLRLYPRGVLRHVMKKGGLVLQAARRSLRWAQAETPRTPR